MNWMRVELEMAAQANRARDDALYPCDKCGTLRTKAQGGTTFTLCDSCWDERYHPKPHRDDAGQDFPTLRDFSASVCADPECCNEYSGDKALANEIDRILDLCQRNSDDLAFLDKVRAENERLRAELRSRTLEHVKIRKRVEAERDALKAEVELLEKEVQKLRLALLEKWMPHEAKKI